MCVCKQMWDLLQEELFLLEPYINTRADRYATGEGKGESKVFMAGVQKGGEMYMDGYRPRYKIELQL